MFSYEYTFSSFFHGAPLLMGAPDQAGATGGTTAVADFHVYSLWSCNFDFLFSHYSTSEQKTEGNSKNAVRVKKG